MIELARSVTGSRRFHNLITAVILVAAVVVGLETSETLAAREQGAMA